MPNLQGRSLRDRMNAVGQLPVADAVRIATEVAGALDHAHRHDVGHRDIKRERVDREELSEPRRPPAGGAPPVVQGCVCASA